MNEISLDALLERLHARNDRLPLGIVLHVIDEVGSQLTRAHAQGAAHGRLDASSIVLASDGEVELRGLEPNGADTQADLLALRTVLQSMIGETGSTEPPPDLPASVGELLDRGESVGELATRARELAEHMHLDASSALLAEYLDGVRPPSDSLERTGAAAVAEPSLRYRRRRTLRAAIIAGVAASVAVGLWLFVRLVLPG